MATAMLITKVCLQDSLSNKYDESINLLLVQTLQGVLGINIMEKVQVGFEMEKVWKKIDFHKKISTRTVVNF